MIILILLIGVAAIGLYFSHRRHGRLTAEAPATVVRTSLHQLGPKDNGRFETDVFFRFDANGSSHEAKYTAAGNRVEAYPAGAAGRVRYNPDRPEEADVIPPS